MSDPVASKSTFLCMYMRSHPDTLVAYVKHFGKVAGNVRSAEMKDIDCKGMNLSYSLKSGDVGSVHIKFDPPLKGYDDVKPRLLAMKADAQETLGMIQSPQITSFRFPSMSAVPILLSAVYFALACHQPEGTPLLCIPANIVDAVLMPARRFYSVIGLRPTMWNFVQSAAAAHVVESLYTWHLCRRYVRGTFTAGAYLSATFIFGWPIWSDLRRRVQEKRIESVMKAE